MFEKKESGGYVFCYKSGRVNYEKAKQICSSNNLKLVEIESEDKANALDSIASNDYTWIGLVCPTKTQECQTDFNLWVWETSNIPLVKTTGWKTRFYKNGGIIYGGKNGENCVHWWKAPGVWAPQTCTEQLRNNYGTLCEKGTVLLIINVQTM